MSQPRNSPALTLPDSDLEEQLLTALDNYDNLQAENTRLRELLQTVHSELEQLTRDHVEANAVLEDVCMQVASIMSGVIASERREHMLQEQGRRLQAQARQLQEEVDVLRSSLLDGPQEAGLVRTALGIQEPEDLDLQVNSVVAWSQYVVSYMHSERQPRFPYDIDKIAYLASLVVGVPSLYAWVLERYPRAGSHERHADVVD